MKKIIAVIVAAFFAANLQAGDSKPFARATPVETKRSFKLQLPFRFDKEVVPVGVEEVKAPSADSVASSSAATQKAPCPPKVCKPKKPAPAAPEYIEPEYITIYTPICITQVTEVDASSQVSMENHVVESSVEYILPPDYHMDVVTNRTNVEFIKPATIDVGVIASDCVQAQFVPAPRPQAVLVQNNCSPQATHIVPQRRSVIVAPQPCPPTVHTSYPYPRYIPQNGCYQGGGYYGGSPVYSNGYYHQGGWRPQTVPVRGYDGFQNHRYQQPPVRQYQMIQSGLPNMRVDRNPFRGPQVQTRLYGVHGVGPQGVPGPSRPVGGLIYP